jgi:Sap-like sulfolipid-1-addressing protein
MTVLLLALEAAVYPTLLAAVVILLGQPRPRRLLATYLAGGLTVSISFGLVAVFALKGTGLTKSQSSGLSWGADLAVGGLALLLAVALATRADERVRRRRAGVEKRAEKRAEKAASSGEPWSERILARGSVPIVFAAAIVLNLPGAAYLIALKDIASGGHSPAGAVALVLAFNAIMFLLAEIPLLGMIYAPDRTGELVTRVNHWVSAHGRGIAASLSAVFGAYLVIRGVANS